MKNEMRQLLYRYIGKGGYIFGIPARNLTARDMLIFNIDEDVVRNCGLYEAVKVEQPEAKEPEIEQPKPKRKYTRKAGK